MSTINGAHLADTPSRRQSGETGRIPKIHAAEHLEQEPRRAGPGGQQVAMIELVAPSIPLKLLNRKCR